jgi:hypothetical protein
VTTFAAKRNLPKDCMADGKTPDWQSIALLWEPLVNPPSGQEVACAIGVISKLSCIRLFIQLRVGAQQPIIRQLARDIVETDRR